MEMLLGRTASYWLKLDCILKKLRLDDERHFPAIEKALKPIDRGTLTDRVDRLEELVRELNPGARL